MAFHCCVCLGELYQPITLNSGITICRHCVCKLRNRCPTTYINVSTKVYNNFLEKFFRFPLPFKLRELLKSSDRIAYINQFDTMELDSSRDLGKILLLKKDEFNLFVSKCINLNCADDIGKSLIHYTYDLERVKQLVANGADINRGDMDNVRLIHYVCWNLGDKALELVKYLISKGANINCADKWGRYPIHYACERKDVPFELIKYLIKQGADSNCINLENGRRPLHYACRKGDKALKLVEILVNHGNVNCIDNEGRRPIHHACIGGDKSLGVVKLLVAYGADILSTDYYCYLPIYYAGEYIEQAPLLNEFLKRITVEVELLNS